MKNQIVIKTALDEGICKSSGGGQTRIHYSWGLGPRNLMTAMETLSEHYASMERGYGNVGHCGSWIEIAGVKIWNEDFSDCEFNTDGSNFRDCHSSAISKTQWCSQFIASVLDGSLQKQRQRNAKYFDQEREASEAGFNAGISGEPMPDGFADHRYQLENAYHDGIQAEADRNHEEEMERCERQQENDEPETIVQTPEYVACTQSELEYFTDCMKQVYEAGNTKLRISKATGEVIFTECCWPRWMGDYWIGVNDLRLDRDNITAAKWQMDHAGIKY
jgi:hypothetical protein